MYFGDVEDDRIVWKKTSGDSMENLDNDTTAQDPRESIKKDEVLKIDSKIQVPWEDDDGDFGVALNGKTLDFLHAHQKSHESVLLKTLRVAQVYARMSPENKANLVELLQVRTEKQIGMCGDGANDCAALKQADAGISLSEAEASIAAPFTSQVFDISCVITLLREGRAALTTTFQAFKFIELYSMIQFFSVTMLYLESSNLSDNQFLYIDIGVLVPLCIF